MNKMMEEMLKAVARDNLSRQLREAYSKINIAKLSNKLTMIQMGLSEEEAMQFINAIEEEIYIEESDRISVTEVIAKKELL